MTNMTEPDPWAAEEVATVASDDFDYTTGQVASEQGAWTPAGYASHIYEYRLAFGTPSFQVLRIPTRQGKTFRQRHWDETTQRWNWTTEGCERVLYRLPEVLIAVAAGETIFIAEGEKDVHTLTAAGLDATTNVGGAGKWLDEYSRALAGANVVICSDTNMVGRAHARAVRESLLAEGCTVKVIEPPAGRTDVSDHLSHGGTMDQMLVVTPEQPPDRARFGIDVLDIITRPIGQVSWVVPKLLAHGERLLLTGFEGTGKSFMCRQFAVQAAAGIHPFNGAHFDGVKVLMIDAENHPDQVSDSWRQLIGLAAHYGKPMEAGMLTVLEAWDDDEVALDLPSGKAWLHERIHAYMPDLVVMGPLTNLVSRDPKDDEPVRRLWKAINSSRQINNPAFILEHHAPHKGPGDKERPVRPYGSSLFLRKPDFGYGLKPTEVDGTFEWAKTRWPRVRARVWPEAVRVGTGAEWPWTECLKPE